MVQVHTHTHSPSILTTNTYSEFTAQVFLSFFLSCFLAAFLGEISVGQLPPYAWHLSLCWTLYASPHTYHATGLVQLAQSRPDERRYLTPEKCLHGHRQAQILQSIILVNVKVIVVVVRRLTVVVRLQIVVVRCCCCPSCCCCCIGHHGGQL